MRAEKYKFTVFTATYNRAYTLLRVYDSLIAQTFRNFEWLIVDDGSTDGTESLIRQWQCEADFPIRYIWQENAGKHMAKNRGASHARGELFLSIDSDDALVPEALDRFKFHWDSIPADQRGEFSTVACLGQDPKGNILGSRFPFDPTDSNSLEIRLKYRVEGDKGGCYRTDVLRQFPYPRFQGETALPDSLVWNRIALKYRTRYINEALEIFFDTPGSWVSNIHTVRAKNPMGTRFYYQEFVNMEYPVPRKELLRAYAHYVRFSCHAGVGITNQVRDIPSPLYWLIALPIGYLRHLRDKQMMRAQTGAG